MQRGVAMKTLIVLLTFFTTITLTATHAQQSITSTENEKTVTHVIGSHYEVVFTNAEGNVLQEEHYLKVGDRYKPHGIWKLYDRNTLILITTAKYNKGEQIWVETVVDGKTIRVSKAE